MRRITPRLKMPALPPPPSLEPKMRVALPDFERVAEVLKPQLPRMPDDEFFAWLRRARRVVLISGPPGTGKTSHSTRLVARGALELSNGAAVVLYDEPGILPAANYFTVAMAQDAARHWRHDFGGICDGQVATIHSLALRTLGFGTRILPVVWKSEDGRLHAHYVNGARPIDDAAFAQNFLRAEASRRSGIPYSLDLYVQAGGNYLFELFDYAVHVGGLPALREAYARLGGHGQAAWRKYLQLLGWPPALVDEILRGRYASLCEAVGGPSELYRLLAEEDVRVDFTLSIEAARCLAMPFTVKCGDRQAPRALLLDEFQDLSPALRDLVARTTPDVRYVVLAGDDDQLIYESLHGASVDVILRVAKMIESGELPGEHHVLGRSFRVPERPIAATARRIIEAVEDRVRKVWVGREAEGVLMRIHLDQLEDAVRSELSAGKRVFILTTDNATAQSIMLELTSAALLPAGLKGLPTQLRHFYADLLEYLKKRNSLDEYLAKTAERRIDPEIARFLAAAKGREAELAAELRLALDTDKALERLEKLKLFVDTVHAAKGLEADVVFLVNSASSQKFVNQRRLTYVALTRAREKVVIVEGGKGHRWLADL